VKEEVLEREKLLGQVSYRQRRMKEGEGGKSDEIMWKESTVAGSCFQV